MPQNLSIFILLSTKKFYKIWNSFVFSNLLAYELTNTERVSDSIFDSSAILSVFEIYGLVKN